MLVSIIGSAGIPAQYGGFETLAEQLVINLQNDVEFEVFCSKSAYKQHPTHYQKARLIYIPLNANGIQSIPYDIVSIFRSLKSDVLLVLGVAGAIIFPFIKLFTRKKIIAHLDGIEWKRDKWNWIAKKYLKFSEGLAVRYADKVIADNEEIQRYVKDTYRKDSVLIEYGADHFSIDHNQEKTPDVQLPEEYAFSVCRIEPENNIHLILAAFSTVPMQLVIVGNWNRSEYGRSLLQEYSKFANIHLLSPIYNQQKLNTIRAKAKIYVHGHSAGGTNPSLVEAMYLKLPVVAFNVSYNKATTENKAFYFSDKQSLKNIVESLSESALIETAGKMSEIAQRRYRWTIVAEKYRALFAL